jgi:hypothetical protein
MRRRLRTYPALIWAHASKDDARLGAFRDAPATLWWADENRAIATPGPRGGTKLDNLGDARFIYGVLSYCCNYRMNLTLVSLERTLPLSLDRLPMPSLLLLTDVPHVGKGRKMVREDQGVLLCR